MSEALQQVLNRLVAASAAARTARSRRSRPVSPIGEIYRYKLVGPPGYSVLDLKTLQDWVLQRRFRAVPGVIDVTGWGGKTKTYELQVDFNKLIAYGLTLPQVLQTLNNSNINVGGNTVDIGPQVRGRARRRSDPLDGRPRQHDADAEQRQSRFWSRDIATVMVGNKPRLGIAGKDDEDDIVQGIVLMRRGEQSTPTIKRVEAGGRQDQQFGHPAAGRADRADLRSQGPDRHHDPHRAAQHGVRHRPDLPAAMVFLGNLRSALIVGATIPFALFFAVGIMVLRGESANLLSVGAIDFGLIVDATVIMVESIFRRLAARCEHRLLRQATLSCKASDGTERQAARDLPAAADVNRSIFFAAGIIIAAFIPLFTLSGVEGHIFGPMAKTYAYALAGGLLATFTVTPALSALLLPEHVRETETWVVRELHRLYTPVLAIRRAPTSDMVVVGAVVLLAVAGLAVRSLGLEFLPKLEEGNLWIRATMPSTISLEEGNGYVNRMRDAHPQLPGSRIGGVAARPAGRRHRCGRLLQRRVLRAAEAGQPMAARARQGHAHR